MCEMMGVLAKIKALIRKMGMWMRWALEGTGQIHMILHRNQRNLDQRSKE